MKIIKAKDYQDMSKKAAIVIASQVTMKPNCVLGLATGSTPIGTYKQLVEWYEEGSLSFADVTSVNLDEYKGITKDNDQSYYYFMNDNLFSHVDINKERTFLPDGTEPDSEKACAAYNEIIHSVFFFSCWSNLPLLLQIAYGVHPLFVTPHFMTDVYCPGRPMDERFHE
jgi:glucosamine-6-phosphate deaminase